MYILCEYVHGLTNGEDMSFLRNFSNACYMFIIPMCLLIIGCIVLFFSGYRDLASAVSNLGTPTLVLGWLAYTVFIDSRKRWPHDHWFVRFHKIATFKRR